jgi:hypothetical protein
MPHHVSPFSRLITHAPSAAQTTGVHEKTAGSFDAAVVRFLLAAHRFQTADLFRSGLWGWLKPAP